MNLKSIVYGKRTKIVVAVALLAMIITAAFSMRPAESVSSNTPKDDFGFSASQTYEIIQNDDDVICIDVRTPMEYRSGYVEGCKLLPVASADFADNVAALDPTKTYIFICRTQNRSRQAATIARRMGLENAYISYGGIKAWREAALPLIKYK